LAPHCLFHAVGQTETGLRVADVWEDDASFQQFAETEIAPNAQRFGLPAPPTIQRLEVTDVVPGSGERPVLFQFVKWPGISREQFTELDGEGRPDGQPPEGMPPHVNGSYDGGSFVLDAWATAEQHGTFTESRIAPVMATAPFDGQPSIEVTPIHNAQIKARTTA